MRHLTIRNVPADLAKALNAARRREGTSLNQTVLDLLAKAVGVGVSDRSSKPRSNGLARLAGDWSEKDLRAFEARAEETRRIDTEVWR